MDSDPDIEFIEREKDSGMESLVDTEKEDSSPERKPAEVKTMQIFDHSENYDDEPDETLAERLLALGEMFPAPLRNVTSAAVDLTGKSVAAIYRFSCNASWIFFTSSMILFAPIIFETERAQMEEMQRSQQKSVLLGPGSGAMSGGGSMPPMPR